MTESHALIQSRWFDAPCAPAGLETIFMNFRGPKALNDGVKVRTLRYKPGITMPPRHATVFDTCGNHPIVWIKSDT